LRGVLREAWRLELIGEADFRRAIDVKGVRGERLPPGRALSLGEVGALFEACARDASPAGARDAAMLAVLFAGGLRRSEVSALDVADFNEQDGLMVRRGKGAKDRLVPFVNGAVAALQDWLKVRGLEPGPIFVPIGKGGHVFVQRLSSQAIYNALAKRAQQAGVENLSPHDCRRTLISHLLEGGADLAVVSKIAGHASVTTTSRYDRRGEEAKRKAAEIFHIPYVRPAAPRKGGVK
jgi:site-specific recombinase XerD